MEVVGVCYETNMRNPVIQDMAGKLHVLCTPAKNVWQHFFKTWGIGMTPQDLKNSSLQPAIQGKLVEQREDEGTAEELYQKICAEKQRLIAEGKIKKEKKLPEITEDEIPESWKWVRLGDISSYGQSKTKVSKDCILPESWSLDLEDIEKETERIVNVVNASEKKYEEIRVAFIREIYCIVSCDHIC